MLTATANPLPKLEAKNSWMSAFLLFRVRTPLRFLWVLAPIVSLAVGTPFGNAYGTMTESAIFGLETGTSCQRQSDAYYVLGGFLFAAVVADLFFYFWGRRYRRWVPLSAAGMVLSSGIFLTVTFFSRHTDQYDLASELSRKYGYFSTGDERWSRPAVLGFPNDFVVSRDVVTDDATGLTWQSSGSPGSVSLSELQGYISGLNSARVGGFDDWRIPSLAEAWTLLEQRQRDGLHVDPVFGSEQEWIWTSTIADDGYGWFIHFSWGRPVFQNAWGSHAFVRAVRGDP